MWSRVVSYTRAIGPPRRASGEPKPFVWTKTAERILASLERLIKRVNGRGALAPSPWGQLAGGVMTFVSIVANAARKR